ncbi:MAG: hypothetical protein PW786_02215 [Arachidicoccus sp.]|nr:hypothetical protein [Arachidicoccus sp.]
MEYSGKEVAAEKATAARWKTLHLSLPFVLSNGTIPKRSQNLFSERPANNQ